LDNTANGHDALYHNQTGFAAGLKEQESLIQKVSARLQGIRPAQVDSNNLSSGSMAQP
jgi:hypothetical protein